MDIFKKLGIRKYINAHDTYTVYGGSRMSPDVLESMQSIAMHFVDFTELEVAVGKLIAELTQNEAAYVTNGAAGAIQLATAVCMCQGDIYKYMRLPNCQGINRNFIVMRCQHNAYDKAIEGAGGRIIEIGDADETLPHELEGVLKESVAAVFYFPSKVYTRASMPLNSVIELAHRYNTPVVVDAAAQLPPMENLWKFTQMGADLVIFSGGKTLCGPQDSGLIMGRKDLISDCHRFGAPSHGICRSSKTSREAVVGIFVALENFLKLDPDAEYTRLTALNEQMSSQILTCGRCKTRLVSYGPVGQTYPRLFIDLDEGISAYEIKQKMRNASIFIGHEGKSTVYISPLNLTNSEAETVAKVLCQVIMED